MAKINFLINKNDNFETIRDEIAAIIALEQAEQKILSASSPISDTTYFNFDLYCEKINPENMIDIDGNNNEPIVNVSYVQSTLQNGNISGRAKYLSEYNIDIYACDSVIVDDENNIIMQSDEVTARRVQRIAKIIRNIIFNNEYAVLNLNGIVASRKIQSIQMFVPNNENTASNISACRIVLQVEHIETTDENIYNSIEMIQTRCLRDNGKLYFDLTIQED